MSRLDREAEGVTTPWESDLRPRITIIVACRNAAAYMDHCLASIAIQDYPDVEVVVMDDASTDGTAEILRRYAVALGGRFTWLSEPDRGIADAWNKAVKRASGDWVLFMGADDALSSPDVLSRIAPHLASAFPKYSIVYGIVAMTDRGAHVIEYLDRPWSPVKFRNCVENLPHSALFHHRSLFGRHGPFDPSFKVILDYDFLLRELMNSAPLRIAGLVVTDAQIGGISTDYRHRLRAVSEHIRLCQRHIGRTPAIMYWWVAKAWGGWLLYKLGGTGLVFRGTNFYRKLIHGRPPLRR